MNIFGKDEWPILPVSSFSALINDPSHDHTVVLNYIFLGTSSLNHQSVVS